jgi:hypothetical protein
VLINARVEGSLEFHGAALSNPGGRVVTLWEVIAGGGIGPETILLGTVDLRHTWVGVLDDVPVGQGNGSGPRLWGFQQDWTVGYGYRPFHAALWLAALLLIGTVVFAIHQPPAFKPDEAPAFNAFLYTLDLPLPIISFGQETALGSRGLQQWLAAAMITAGWILAKPSWQASLVHSPANNSGQMRSPRHHQRAVCEMMPGMSLRDRVNL